MMPTDLQRWAEQQVQALVDLGIDVRDAESNVRWIVEYIPEGADPNRWVIPAELLLYDANVQPEDIQDARVDWYASDDVPNRFKRILDAKREEGNAD